MAHRFENVCEIILDLEGESKEKKFTRSYNFTKKKNGEMEAKGIFNDVLVSSTLTLPVNIFTWKKEKLCSSGETKFFFKIKKK